MNKTLSVCGVGLMLILAGSFAGAVVLWAQRPETADPEVLTRLRRVPVRRFTAGPGWPARRRGGAEHVDSLPAALSRLLDELGELGGP